LNRNEIPLSRKISGSTLKKCLPYTWAVTNSRLKRYIGDAADTGDIDRQVLSMGAIDGPIQQRPYAGALPDEFPGFFRRIIPIDRQAKTATVAPGVVVPVRGHTSASWGSRRCPLWAV
jgi:hypothetical protein